MWSFYHFDYEIADFKGSNYSFYTTAGEWTTVTVEFTVSDDIHCNEAIRSHILFLYAENKSVAALDPDAAVNVRNMAAATVKPSNYAGAPGLNSSYTTYSNANAVAEAGKVTYYEDLSNGFYIDDVVFEEVTTAVKIATTAPMLSITPTATSDILPTVSASVLSTDPDNAQDGLWISGGLEGFDTKSVKSYIKLSLDGYYGGFSAFVFDAKSEGEANVSVYAIADVNAGQSWTADSITSANAPANDIYGSGVNLNAVYGNKALASFAVGTTSKSYVVELTELTEYMLDRGAEQITLILVSDAKNVTTIEIPSGETVTKVDEFDCVNKGFSVAASGYTLDQSTYKFNSFNGAGYGLQLDLRAMSASGGVNNNQNTRLHIFDTVWVDSGYIGKTVRFTFEAKASEAGSIKLALNQHGNGNYVWGDGWGLISADTAIGTEWQTYTYEFVVTEELFNAKNNSTSSTPNIALGVRFSGFIGEDGKYKGAQLNFRNFVINTVGKSEDENAYHLHYDFSSTKPVVDTRGYGKQLATIVDGELQIDLTKDTQAPNANGYTRVEALNDLFADQSNAGKTFVITFRAKATEAGLLDFAFNKFGSFNTYAYNGVTYKTQYQLTTEYQTFTYTFVALDDMFTTHATSNLNLAFRLYNGYLDGSAYKAAQIYIDDIAITENPYVRSVDYTYDFSASKPVFDTRGYGKQLASVVNEELQIDLTKDTQAPNANAYTRIEALNGVITGENVGKTFAITFRAKATEAGLLDFAFNKFGSFNTYAYGGRTYKDQYHLTTEYQTFTFTFTVSEDMVSTHATSALNLAFRLYNGFGGATGAYKSAQAYIDDIRIYEQIVVSRPTLGVTEGVAVSGLGNSNNLTVYADDSAAGAPKIQKTYLYYDLSAVTTSYGATLKVNLSGVNGETVLLYLLPDTTLTAPVTFTNAPIPTGSAIASFIAKDGINSVDISEAVANNSGKNVVIVLAIEEPSGQIQVTSDPTLKVSQYYHDYTSETQKHSAVAPTYKTPGNVEFYTCAGCDKLYVKEGGQFVQVSIEDIIIPILVCTEHNYVEGICTICGKKDIHKCTGGVATCLDKAICSICGKEYGDLAGHTEVIDAAKAPTCTESGLTEGKHCSVCNEVLVAQTIVDALGHTEVIDAAKTPTCTETGLTEGKHCSVCNEVLIAQTVVDALGHTEVIDAAKTPTCTETGLTEGKHCSVCNEVLIAQTIVDALGHTEVIDAAKAPTCTETGLTEGKRCSVCDEVLIAQTIVDALGHTEVIDAAKAPTCTETGLTEGKHCSVCNEVLVAQETIAALGHTEITVPGKVSGCTESGLTDGTKCFTCNEIIIAQTEIPANGHSYNTVVTAPTCTEDGYTTYNCSVCGDSYVSDEVQAEGHSWKDANTESPKICEKCGATEGEKLSLMEAFWKIIKIFIDFLKKLFESIKLNLGDVLGKK